MKLIHLRHATILLETAGKRILIDPCLGKAGSLDPVRCRVPDREMRNPLVELPGDEASLSKLMDSVDLILVTHFHRDHFSGLERFPSLINKPMYAPAHAVKAMKKAGVPHQVHRLESSHLFEGFRLSQVLSPHGRGLLQHLMGKNSGFVIESATDLKTFIIGDGVWGRSVKQALRRHQPGLVIANAGSATMFAGAPITMNSRDVAQVLKHSGKAPVIAVHLDAYNHCVEGRADLMARLAGHPERSRLLIPKDGETLEVVS